MREAPHESAESAGGRVTCTVITPWYGHRELEKDYWDAMRMADARVIVIDNGSQPPLPNGYRLDFNSGFSHACNVGLSLVTTESVAFVNNDIRAADPDWLRTIEDALEPGVLVGPQIRYDTHAAVDGESFPYLDGWCLAGMTEDLRELGGFDEGLMEPAYFSDNLICLEARAAGMTLREVRVGLGHKGNATAGPQTDPGVRSAFLANRERFCARASELLEGVAA